MDTDLLAIAGAGIALVIAWPSLAFLCRFLHSGEPFWGHR